MIKLYHAIPFFSPVGFEWRSQFFLKRSKIGSNASGLRTEEVPRITVSENTGEERDEHDKNNGCRTCLACSFFQTEDGLFRVPKQKQRLGPRLLCHRELISSII